MEAKAVVTTRLDGFDAEAFADMLGSSSFAILRKRIESELERSRKDCETSSEPLLLHRAQGSVAALRAVLGLPESILRDMRSPKK